MVDVWDIRNELRGLRNLVTEWNNNHLLGLTPGVMATHDQTSCPRCLGNAGILSGIKLAIRRFGGIER